MLVALSASFANNSASAAILGHGGTAAIAKGEQQNCFQNEVKAAAIGIRDSSGNAIKQAAAGSQVSIQAIIKNDCGVSDYPATIILEIRNSSGITKYLALQQTALEQGQSARISVSWMPDKAGDYKVRVFVVTCPNCLGVLSPITTYEISVR